MKKRGAWGEFGPTSAMCRAEPPAVPWDPRRRRKQPGGWGAGPGAGGVERHEIQEIQTGSDKAEASVGDWGHRQGDGWETDRQGRRSGRRCASEEAASRGRGGGAWQNRGGVKGKPQDPRKEGYPLSHPLLRPLPSTFPAGTGFLCLHPHRCPVSWVCPHLTDRSEAQLREDAGLGQDQRARGI